ncbi:DUF58 domain-containing protein [Ottowia sp.]|uniref:DUF58 domain-containing protein n=1 Tax=Ottowia sp. TaxID=1898956 RepID=UPI002CE494CD|nr:DUF58 domain-containing protein [Ottowia sp.]HRN75433.1 DUF58 domain-containing protein [Ottowia sp.]HRQ03030.1 DUF58 domain-containing protein [Ottowia sp.]
MTAAVTALPWWAWRTRMRAWLRQWWLERLPRSDTLTLTQRRIYILPTRAGWMLASTLVVLLVGSINYQLNLGYLLTFLLAGSAAAGMVLGHGTLRGLTLQLLPPQPLFAGGLAVLDVQLLNRRRTPRHAIGVALLDSAHWSWADVPAQGQTTVQISLQPARRGLHRVPALTAETRFPLGTFRIWTVWRPAAQLLVYPAPEPLPPALPAGEPRSGSGTAAGPRASGEFDGVRPYQRGDPMKLIVWKKFAKSSELISRDTQQMQRQALWLDFARAGALSAEARLSRLAAWVLLADAQGLDYGLRLPGVEIAPAGGPAQRLRCLEALARA